MIKLPKLKITFINLFNEPVLDTSDEQASINNRKLLVNDVQADIDQALNDITSLVELKGLYQKRIDRDIARIKEKKFLHYVRTGKFYD